MHVTTRWRIPPAAWIPIALAIGAESISNALRAYALGSHLDRFTVIVKHHPVSIAGAVLVVAAVAVSFSQARAAWVALTPSGPVRQRIVAGLAACLLLSISVTAMASHILEAQRAKVADEGGARGRYDRAKTAYEKAAAELATLGNPRPVSVIQAEVQSTKIDMAVWRRSQQCADISRDDTKEVCEPILKLYKERGAAARKAELEPQVTRLRAELAKMDRPEEASASETTVASYWAWIMGLGVVFIATFGTVIFARVDRTDPPPATAAEPLSPPDTQQPRGLPPEPPGGRRAATKDEALADLQRLLASGAVITSQDMLVKRWNLGSKGTASKWLKEWTEQGAIPERSAVGRCKQIVAA